MKRIDVDGNPHLCLFALNDISEGEEITYDYGGGDCPWRTQVCGTITVFKCCRMSHNNFVVEGINMWN